jgi:hypothetical protein
MQAANAQALQDRAASEQFRVNPEADLRSCTDSDFSIYL